MPSEPAGPRAEMVCEMEMSMLMLREDRHLQRMELVAYICAMEGVGPIGFVDTVRVRACGGIGNIVAGAEHVAERPYFERLLGSGWSRCSLDKSREASDKEEGVESMHVDVYVSLEMMFR